MPNPNQLNPNVNPHPLDSIEQPIDNQEHSVESSEPHSNIPEQSNNKELIPDKTRIQNELGSKVLSLVNFESKHKDIVESSFNKARNNHDKLPGKNNERRNYAYLSRLNSLIEKHGDNLEQRLWQASASKVIIKPEDITDKYWKQQEQILRNEGQGRILSNYEKDYLTKEIIIAEQERTITPWVNYLSNKDCPYPTWFKVYAFDGLSRMGLYNDKTKEFEKRDKHTVGRFPNLNPEVLAKVYSHINDFFNQDSSAWFEKHPEDEKLSVLVKSGNFNKLYSKELLDARVIMKTPERTEDVHGDWFEYKLGDEEQISRLAEGTRWCIADPHTANNYLSWGTYNGNGIEDYDDNYDDSDEYDNYKGNSHNDSKARFFIFRLKADQSKDGYADNGSASIRLGPDGNVAEVSGLKDGQALEDALVPIVQEKVLNLPGGEKYNQRFADKQELIRLDKKMQNSQDLTKEELEFIYELNRNIATLDTYNHNDPRLEELKDKYNVQYILDHDIEIDLNKLVEKIDTDDIIDNLDALINHNVSIDELVSGMDYDDIIENLDTLLNHGADVNILIKRMDSYDIANNLDTLINHGADINILIRNMDPSDIAKNLDALINHGADIDVNELSKRMNPSGIAKNLDALINHGADIDVNELSKRMDSYDIVENLDTLINHGADINAVVSKMSPNNIVKNREKLLAYGANLDN